MQPNNSDIDLALSMNIDKKELMYSKQFSPTNNADLQKHTKFTKSSQDIKSYDKIKGVHKRTSMKATANNPMSTAFGIEFNHRTSADLPP